MEPEASSDVGGQGPMKRREFLDWLVWVSGTTLSAFVFYPVLRYLVPPNTPEAATRRVIAARAQEVAPGGFKIFAFGGQPAILIRTGETEYCAFSAVCTHLGCTVQYRAANQDIWCACHNGVYDLQGRNVSGPPPRPLERYEVHAAGDQVVVEKANAT